MAPPGISVFTLTGFVTNVLPFDLTCWECTHAQSNNQRAYPEQQMVQLYVAAPQIEY